MMAGSGSFGTQGDDFETGKGGGKAKFSQNLLKQGKESCPTILSDMIRGGQPVNARFHFSYQYFRMTLFVWH